MGEYATYKGHEIKIGTCESMYYLRADQAARVSPLRGNVDPIKDAKEIRFRFPFPDEDKNEPGNFEPYERALYLSGLTIPEGVTHSRVQFTARGYVTSLPCPESSSYDGPAFHRNGFPGSVGICQQRVWNGYLALVCKCGGCGTLWRYETLEQAVPVIDACRKEAKHYPGESSEAFWNEIAERIIAGYSVDWRNVDAQEVDELAPCIVCGEPLPKSRLCDCMADDMAARGTP